jgi:transcriptional regulator with XRE-family HTH domain
MVYAALMAHEKAQLGERIRSARAAKGWKQKHLAAEVEVEPITVSRWERGATTPDLDVLGRVAEATGMPVGYFVGGGVPSSSGNSSLEDAASRIETAALQIASEVDRLAAAIEELRAELARSR